MLKLKVSKAEGTWNCEKKKAVFLVYKSKQKKVKLLQFGSFNFDFHKKKTNSFEFNKNKLLCNTQKSFWKQAKEASFLFNNKLGFSKTKQKQRGTFSAVKRLPQNCWLASRLFRWKKMVLEIVSFLFLNLPFFFILAFVTKQISFFPTSFFLLATLNKVKSARLALVCFLYSQ